MNAHWLRTLAAAGLIGVFACGPQGGGDPSSAGDGGAPTADGGGSTRDGDAPGTDPDAAGADASAGGADAGPDAGSGAVPECTESSHCPGDAICDPDTQECSESTACTGHDACGDGAHCADDGTCTKSDTGSPCDETRDCQVGEECLGGFCGCEGTSFEAEPVPINMLMVLDRSNSMQCHVDGTDNAVGADDPSSRWQAALGAVDALLAEYDPIIRFGLAVYPGLATEPGDPSTALCVGAGDCNTASLCATGERVVEVQASAGAAIQTQLDSGSVDPGGCTPSGPALAAQVGYDRLADPAAENYILYLTDGAENCSKSPDQVAAITSLREQSPPVRTFVVGFTDQVNPDELNAAAEAGGTARDGALKYYQANDEAALTAALEEIGGEVLSCSFALDEVPEDLDELFVYVDDQSIIRDTAQQNGWDYDPADNSISFFGSICDELQAGGAGEVDVVHGCPIDISAR